MKIRTLSHYLLQDLTIKDRVIHNRIVLAPMAGLGHIALRQLICEFGGFGLLFTGMCSAKAVPHENPDTSLVFKWRKEELECLVCQIFGPDPESMARAAERIEKEGFFGVDLNFGCSVATICKKGCGAALLKNPDLSSKIVKAVRKSVSIPVFVKFRTGWDNNPQFAVDMARRFEDAGADALTFHPRVAPDRRNRPPRWDVIKLVKQAVGIPVFGNGNLFQAEDGVKMIEQTSCQGLSVGRMAVARPWLFAQWTKDFSPGDDIFFTSAMRMTQILLDHYDDHFSVKLFKKFSPYFCANFKFGHHILKKLVRAQTMDDIRTNLDSIFETNPETLSRPNQNLFL
ncbi:tRNA-dihydrouridine synthase family protein [Desulfobacula sp.]|uniref:tRNA dihydrouridine synthase n=1 Tax=Desulfobacula sp. TaxID=2593537 RepID=UPI0025BC9CF5|nr:tRNA-dihydrouridine synthase family protein [Desulfobacula sp.]MBC2705215.1 tRNA-dihydrouridine synthase family protein [Desulfobacula sp.]